MQLENHDADPLHPALWRQRRDEKNVRRDTIDKAPLGAWLRHVWHNELLAHRSWIDRALVLAYALVTGLLLVAMTHLANLATHAYDRLFGPDQAGAFLSLLWTPALTVAIVWWTRRAAPATAGSGIPQVMRCLRESGSRARRSLWVSLEISLHKVALISAGLLAGLSIGREGPAVQIGAGVMQHARRWLSRSSRISRDDLIVAGAAAGIAAAFNTPLGGIVFALEKLSGGHSKNRSGLMIACIVLVGLVSISFFGNQTYFGRLQVHDVSWSLLPQGLLVALATGLAGGLFSRLLIVSLTDTQHRISRLRNAHPLRFALACGLAVALLGLASHGTTSGTGYATTRALLEGQADTPLVYTVLKFCSTWISSWSGAPGGIFAPSLAIGAAIGHDVAALSHLGQAASIPLIALGMVGFLAATTQGPITAFIIVMEMVSGYPMVLSLMAAAFLASGIARLISRPLYAELASLLVPAAAVDRAMPPRRA